MPSGWRPAEVQLADFVAGARAAGGLAVIIDVFRAFSVAAHACARGARAIVPVAIIHTTHSGTQGLAAASHADEVITGALVNAAAIVRYIRSRAPDTVTSAAGRRHN